MIMLEENDSLQTAAETLFKHKILAAPVFNADNECIGAIDLLTVLQYPANLREASSPSSSDSSSQEGKQDYSSRFWNAIRKVHVKDALALAKQKNLIPFYIDNPVSMLLDLLGTGVHRVALFAKDKELISTCSQSDALTFICKAMLDPQASNAAELAATAAIPAASLGLLRKCITFPASEPLLKALAALAQSSRRAFALVDEEGKFVGELSTSDLHNFPDANFSTLLMPAGEWIAKFSPSSLNPVCTTLSSTFGQVVELLASKRLHRLWIVNEEGEPTHIVSLTDVMRVLTSGDAVDSRMASGDADITKLWRAPPLPC